MLNHKDIHNPQNKTKVDAYCAFLQEYTEAVTSVTSTVEK